MGTKLEGIIKHFESKSIRYIRLTWVDNVNCVRYRIIPVNHFKKLISKGQSPDDEHTASASSNSAANGHGGITIAKVTLGLVGVQCAPGFGPVGMYLYVPDLTSLRELSFAPGHASVMGWFEEREGRLDNTKRMSFDVDLCPRTLLRRVVEQANASHGISFLMGFETEVMILRSTSPIVAVNEYSWSESPAILAGSPESSALEEIADSLERAGIQLEMYHSEGAPGQYEFVTGPLPPLEACDALVSTREIILNVCAKHGLKSTMTPRMYSDNCGNATHTHISLTSTKLPSTQLRLPGDSTPSLTGYEASFLAGLLDHLPAVTAFTLPTPASYGRMVDGVWSGGTYVAWGWENKETPIRLCGIPGTGLKNYHFEIKSVDGTASPYLVAASLLAAGMDGVKSQAAMRMEGMRDGLASSLSLEEREKKGVITRMPLNLQEARTALKTDAVMNYTLGKHFIESYLSVNQTMSDYLQKGDDNEQLLRMVNTF